MALVCGIDWAVDPRKRAAVVLETGAPGAGVAIQEIVHPVTNTAVQGLCARPELDVVGVDTPFGWPAAFSRFVGVWAPGGGESAIVPDTSEFPYRRTDHVVRTELRKQPLSVSSDRIALSARAWLQLAVTGGQVRQFDVGASREPAQGPTIIEVYPAATLTALYPKSGELRTDGYKKDPEIRQHILSGLIRDRGLVCSDEQQARLVSAGDDSDKLDALLAAITGLFYLGVVEGWTARRPAPGEVDLALREGWIFFPVPEPRVGPR